MSLGRPCKVLLLVTGLALQAGCSASSGSGSAAPPTADAGAHADAATATGQDASADTASLADTGTPTGEAASDASSIPPEPG